jgi:hypothetical protein
VTVHSARWEERVDQSRNPPKARMTSSVSTLPRLVNASSSRVSYHVPRPRNPRPGLAVLQEAPVLCGAYVKGCKEWNVKQS